MLGLEPTPFDLRLVAFRIPVRVHPTFWIAGIVLGWHPEMPPFLIFLWVMCVFVSILVHELGHAVMAEVFGWPSEVVLYWCGGLAYSRRSFNRTPLREMAVALAGPCAGFGLYGLVVGSYILLGLDHVLMPESVYVIYFYLTWINLYWGLVNLLPVLPLDGGNVCQSLLELCRFRYPERNSMQVSVVVGACASLFFFYVQSRFAGILFALLCLQNLASLQQPHYR